MEYSNYGILINGQVERATDWMFGANNPTLDMLMENGYKEISTVEGIGLNHYEGDLLIEYIAPTVISSSEIQALRHQQYKLRSDDLYMAYIKYQALGQLQKAEEKKQQWLQEVNAIDSEFSYTDKTGKTYNIMLQNPNTGNVIIVKEIDLESNRVTIEWLEDFYCVSGVISTVEIANMNFLVRDNSIPVIGTTPYEILDNRISHGLLQLPDFSEFTQKSTRDWEYPEWMFRIHLTDSLVKKLSLGYKTYVDSLYAYPPNPLVETITGAELYVDTIPVEMVIVLAKAGVNIDTNPNPQ